jgi:hypothetical protein
MSNAPISWRLRRRFWAHWQTFRYDLSKPKQMQRPEDNTRIIGLKPFCEIYPELPMKNILVFDELPGVERNLGMRVLVALGLFLNRFYPQMQRGLPEIDADIDKALADALLPIYRDTYRVPAKPEVYTKEGAPELGDLAVEGPFSIFIERDTPDTLKWDFEFLERYEHYPELHSLAVKVIFSDPQGKGRPVPQRISSNAFGEVTRDHPQWDQSALLAICAASTHLALTRHFNYVHLISGNHWDVITRNYLPTDHPLYLLLWPHILDSCYTNYGVTRTQMLPDGDFVNMFSFTHKGLMDYFDDMHLKYDVRMMDPQSDWERRGLGDSLVDKPSHDNLLELFAVMHGHAGRYIYQYYASDAALRKDDEVIYWLRKLHETIPNGIPPELISHPSRAGLARFIGSYIYEGSTVHTLAGTNLWDYQLWMDKNPVRIYKNGQRVPLDVYQRVLNNNFALQLDRDPLFGDYRDIVSDQKGRRLFARFNMECRKLQVKYDLMRWKTADHSIWRMEPKNLDISMNG